MTFTPLKKVKIIPNVSKAPNRKKARCNPATKAPADSVETESRLGSNPLEPIVMTTMVVLIAMLATFPEFRTS